MADSTASSTKESRMVTGLFRDKESAEPAWQSAINRGYDRDEINLLMSDETRRKYFADVGSSRVDLQACKLEYSIVSPK